jgi:hypothetical protein
MLFRITPEMDARKSISTKAYRLASGRSQQKIIDCRACSLVT